MKPNLNNAKLLLSAGNVSQIPSGGIPQIVFSGRSNVGKSTLINSLLGRKSLARISSAPGKTVTVNFYDIDGMLLFADLPGYGFARRSYEEKERFSALTDGYLTSCHDMALILQLIDLSAGITKDDRAMLGWLAMCRVPYCIIGTKADKLNKTELKAAVSGLTEDKATGAAPIIVFSSRTGEGRDEVWSKIYGVIR